MMTLAVIMMMTLTEEETLARTWPAIRAGYNDYMMMMMMKDDDYLMII